MQCTCRQKGRGTLSNATCQRARACRVTGVARRKRTSTRSSPALHAQADEVAEPTGDVEWLGQLMQPEQLAYWPAAHWLHDCPLPHV